MIALLLLVKLFATFVLADSDNESLQSGLTRRVLYGDEAWIEDYPYFASLGYCGGAILSQIWIATAAHCVANAQTRGRQLVYVGGNTIQDSITYYYIDVIIHPEHTKLHNGILLNDIALLVLHAPLQYSDKVQPAQLPTSSPPRNVVVVTRGSDETGRTSTYLTKVDHIVLSAQECLSMISLPDYYYFVLQNLQELQKMSLCTVRREDLPGVCSGDSGSPVLSGNILVGIHSSGSLPCLSGKLSSETYVLNYVPWISAHTGL